MEKLLEALIGRFLGFEGIARKNAHKLLINWIPFGSKIKRRGYRAMRLKGWPNSKVKTKPAQNILRGDFQKVIPEAIESLKKPSSYGAIVPARW